MKIIVYVGIFTYDGGMDTIVCENYELAIKARDTIVKNNWDEFFTESITSFSKDQAAEMYFEAAADNNGESFIIEQTELIRK